MSVAAGREASQHFPVDQKARFLRDLVVQLHGRFICLVRLPIHPVAAGPSCVSIDLFDQRAPYSLPSCRFLCEQVLQQQFDVSVVVLR